jgi:hypothetical protein
MMKNDRMKTKKSDEKKKVNKEKHRVRHTILAIIATVICISTAAFAQTNVLVNGDFESNPPTGCGNHIPWSILPWVIGTTGQQANVVTTFIRASLHNVAARWYSVVRFQPVEINLVRRM